MADKVLVVIIALATGFAWSSVMNLYELRNLRGIKEELKAICKALEKRNKKP